MSEEDVDLVHRAVAAINARDLDGYLACCTDDIEIQIMSLAAVGGVYSGREAIHRFWTDIADTSPDFHIEVERIEPTPAGGLVAFMRVDATGRATGIRLMDHVPTLNIYDFKDGKVDRVRIFNDRAEGLAAAGID
jgi:hypothetical protein